MSTDIEPEFHENLKVALDLVKELFRRATDDALPPVSSRHDLISHHIARASDSLREALLIGEGKTFY